MLLVRGFALLLLFVIAALAFETAIPDRESGRLARRAALEPSQTQALAAYEGAGDCEGGAACADVAAAPVSQN